jgi:hypothetical protein
MSFYSYCLKQGKEYLLEQWDAEKNAPLIPESIGSTNTTRVWWKCEKGHGWQTQLASRARGNSGCPLCMREKIAARVENRRAAEAKKKQARGRNAKTGGKEK